MLPYRNYTISISKDKEVNHYEIGEYMRHVEDKCKFRVFENGVLVKFKPTNNALMPGFNDVFDSIFNDTFFNDRMVSRVPAVNISESENNTMSNSPHRVLKKKISN